MAPSFPDSWKFLKSELLQANQILSGSSVLDHVHALEAPPPSLVGRRDPLTPACVLLATLAVQVPCQRVPAPSGSSQPAGPDATHDTHVRPTEWRCTAALGCVVQWASQPDSLKEANLWP